MGDTKMSLFFPFSNPNSFLSSLPQKSHSLYVVQYIRLLLDVPEPLRHAQLLLLLTESSAASRCTDVIFFALRRCSLKSSRTPAAAFMES